MSVYQFGPFSLDASRMLLLHGSEPVALGPKVVETLLALVEHPGDVVTKSALLDRIWPEAYVDEGNLAQNVHALRKVLRSRWDIDPIETIPRRGYRFTAHVGLLHALPSAQPMIATADSAPRRARLVRVAVAAICIACIGVTLFYGARPPRAMATAPLSPEGARMYQIGHYYWNTRTPRGLSKSLAYFMRVVESDPGNARSYAALASADAIMADYHYGELSSREYYARANAYARKALLLDPNCSDAYAVIGMIETNTSAYEPVLLAKGIADLLRAIELDPANGPAHEWYGIALLNEGRVKDAYAELRHAADLDPLSVATNSWLGGLAYLNGRYADAIEDAVDTLDLAPQRYEVLETLGLAYEARGEFPRAIAVFKRLGSLCSDCRGEAAALLAGVDARTRRLNQARIEIAIAQAHPASVQEEDLAIAFVSIGERRAGLARLHRIRGEMRTKVDYDPRFSALRNDPAVKRLET